jgi:hypothetical protein
LVFCLDVVIFLFYPFNSFRPLMKALSPLVRVGFVFYREKSSLSILINFYFMGMIEARPRALWVGPGSSWSVCTVKHRFSSASASISPSGCGADRFIAALLNAALFPEVSRNPFRCIGSFCVYAMISTSAGGGSASTLCILSTPGWVYN